MNDYVRGSLCKFDLMQVLKLYKNGGDQSFCAQLDIKTQKVFFTYFLKFHNNGANSAFILTEHSLFLIHLSE